VKVKGGGRRLWGLSDLLVRMPAPAEQVDDDDEVLLALAEQLGGFVWLVGGPAHAHVLVPALEALAAVEESTVREKVRLGVPVIDDGWLLSPTSTPPPPPPPPLRTAGGGLPEAHRHRASTPGAG